jgi:GNAT superfamily N-acetyltransferase
MEITIRNILISDASSVSRLSEQLGYSLSENTGDNIKNILALTDHIAFVAIDDKEVVGWVHAFKTTTIESSPFIELAGLVVDEKYRGNGIGKKLVEYVKQWCAGKKISLLRARSNVKRKEAHKFYLDLGFTEIKEQKAFQMYL